MPPSVLIASLGKSLLSLYLMSGMTHTYLGKSLKSPMFLNFSYTLQIGPSHSPDYHSTPIYLSIHLTAADMKCSGLLSAPALFQASVRQPRTMFWRFEINIMLCAGESWSHQWMTTYRNGNTDLSQSKDDLLLVSWYNLEEAKLLFQILSSIKKEDDCRLACEDFNLCTNYTFLGPENPLRWANTKSSHPKVCILLLSPLFVSLFIEWWTWFEWIWPWLRSLCDMYHSLRAWDN